MRETPINRADAPTAGAQKEFSSRCEQLGLTLWWLGAGEAPRLLCDGAHGSTLRQDWLHSESAGRLLEDAAAADPGGSEPWTYAPHPGLRLIVLPTGRPSRRAGWHIALTVDALGLSTAPLGAIAGRSDGATLARDLAASATSVRTDDCIRWLGWMHGDLLRGQRADEAIESFGRELTETYEELGLMYRLGRSMGGIATPGQFIRGLCEELVETLPFAWVAVRIPEEAPVPKKLRGRTIMAGRAPFQADRFADGADTLIPRMPVSDWVLQPSDAGTELSDLAGSQVVVHPITRGGTVMGLLAVGGKTGDDPEVASFETQLIDASADFLGVFIENAALYAEQRAMFIGTVEALTAAVDAKDPYTCGHSLRVAHLGEQLALASGMSAEEAERVRITGLLHDVGKIGVPESALTKQGRLTDEEFEQIKRHPGIGYRILKDIPALEYTLPGVLHHHERFDGRGYPEGLSGAEIPFDARILAVADSFDAMSSTRSYRAAMPREKVLGEIRRCAGAQFDPELAGRFLDLDLSEYDRMLLEHGAAGRREAA